MRRLLMGATQLVLLYGAEVLADALNKEVHRKRLAQVQRREALRTTFAYRTISEPTVMVIAGVIPVALRAKERKAIYRRKSNNLRELVAREEHQRTFTECQLSWQNEPRGRWDTRLMDNLDPWLNRTHGEIDYFLFSPTYTGLGKRDLLNTPFSLAKDGTAPLAALCRHRGALSRQHCQRDAEKRWQLESHYVRANLNSADGGIGW